MGIHNAAREGHYSTVHLIPRNMGPKHDEQPGRLAYCFERLAAVTDNLHSDTVPLQGIDPGRRSQVARSYTMEDGWVGGGGTAKIACVRPRARCACHLLRFTVTRRQRVKGTSEFHVTTVTSFTCYGCEVKFGFSESYTTVHSFIRLGRGAHQRFFRGSVASC